MQHCEVPNYIKRTCMQIKMQHIKHSICHIHKNQVKCPLYNKLEESNMERAGNSHRESIKFN